MRTRLKYTGIILTLLVILPIISFEGEDLRVYKGNLFHDTFFKDPIEKLVIIFPDGTFFFFTTLEEYTVSVDCWVCMAILKQNGRDIADAVIVIHNHPMGFPRFSNLDLNFLQALKRNGFKGSFLLYHQPTKTVITHGE